MIYIVAGNCAEAEYWYRRKGLDSSDIKLITGTKMVLRLYIFKYVLVGTYWMRNDWKRMRGYLGHRGGIEISEEEI